MFSMGTSCKKCGAEIEGYLCADCHTESDDNAGCAACGGSQMQPRCTKCGESEINCVCAGDANAEEGDADYGDAEDDE